MEFSPDIIEKLPKLEIFSDFTENTEDNLGKAKPMQIGDDGAPIKN